MSALFITFEGLDGSGKSTHLRRAVAWMEERGLPVRSTQEPGGTPLGEAIREVFLDRRWKGLDHRVEALLVFASRRQHLLEVIEPSLAEGCHVLCDRFTDSTLVYQGSGCDQPWEWILEIDRVATGGRRPDYTLLFDLPPEIGQGRGQSAKRRAQGLVDRLDGETLEFYRRAREGYRELERGEPERFRRLDSSGEAENTWRQVEAVLEEILGDHAAGSGG